MKDLGYRSGDRVCFFMHQFIRKGTVVRVNQKSITVECDPVFGFNYGKSRITKPNRIAKEDESVVAVFELDVGAEGRYFFDRSDENGHFAKPSREWMGQPYHYLTMEKGKLNTGN